MKLLLFFSLLTVCYCFEDKSLLQYLTDNGYSLFVRLITEAKLETSLNGTGPYTVLAPTDAAIARLDPDTMVTLSKNDLLLKNVLKYHILNGFVLIPELKSGKDEMTLNGQSVAVSKVNDTIIFNNKSMMTKDGDIILNNGVVHPIDTVLIPPLFSSNNLATELLVRDDKFSEFLFSLLLTNMTYLIERGEYTIFAPTDSAFTSGIGALFYRDMPNAGHFYNEMLQYHIVPGARASNQLTNGQVVYTLHGTPITIKIKSDGVYADDAKVTMPDIGASNGVIHGIDHLLFPDDLRKELETLQQQSG